MESENARSGAERKLFEALDATEPQQATEALDDLVFALQSQGVDGLSPLKLWNRFKQLLHRRGYYVDTPARLDASLDEILAVGKGFDLFELARSLAAYDDARKESRGTHGAHALPQLRRFAEADSPPGIRKET